MANWAVDIQGNIGAHALKCRFFPKQSLIYVPLFSKQSLAISNSYPTSFSSSISFNLPIQLNKNKKKKTHILFSAISSNIEEEEEIKSAKEVTRDFLEQELGLCSEEAKEIAFSCPKYVVMLVQEVHELEEISLSMLSNSISLDEDVSKMTFKDKVFELVLKKGDKGVLPFLESLGLSLPSATHLARYVSSFSLLDLIRQVKYLKEIFFSGRGDEAVIGKTARRMMMHLSISVDDDLQQTLSFFEKIQARRGGLDLLGYQDASLRYLIESFPRLLLLPLETHVLPILEFIESIGVPEQCRSKLLILFPPMMFYNVEKDIRPRIKALRNARLKEEELPKMLMKYPWILSTSILENSEKVFDLFDSEKVPQNSVAGAISKWPYILGASVNKLLLMLKQFADLDIRGKKLGQVISRSPNLLLQRPQEFHQVIFFLQDLELDDESVTRILCRCPEMFAANLDKTLKKKLDFLTEIGISKTHLPRVIRKYPELFVCDINKALLPRIKYLMKIGLRQRDVSFMVRRFSPLLGYSINEVLKPKVEFLLNVMERPLNDVVDYPRYFSYSLEKRIKPRYFMLKGIDRDCSLKEMLGKNDEEFAAEFMDIDRKVVVD
ncbi:hypothetical protein LIER_35468 [Lithospermum erythrorhizon]|uniref:Uncharacterized protein n=1 Tax=Lithospermum erythrorhizon TaxID=34254 RepID=A0AAV3NSN3_LITER